MPRLAAVIAGLSVAAFFLSGDLSASARSGSSLGAYYGDPAWSPDGNSIAFASDVGDLAKFPEIYVMRADGSSVQRLTSDAYGHAGPAWSPDGKTIAYQAFGYIDRINIDGTHWKRLFAHAGEDFGACCPAWSPNGQKIAYVNGHGNVATIWVMRSDGSNKRRIASPTADGVGYTDPTWSPNGTWIAFSYLLPARNGSARGYLGLIRATGRGRIKRLKLGYAPWQPAWSRDGSKIAVSDTLDRIEVLNLRTGRISRLLTGQHPSWSRGGSSIVYDCGSGSPTRTYRGPGEICTMRVDGSHMRRLTH